MSAASLLFAPGERPGAEAVAALAQVGSGFAISFDPVEDLAAERGPPETDPSEGGRGETRWLELLANGLTFDLCGLAPGDPAARPAHGHSFGLRQGFDSEPLEAITLQPGPHLASGTTMPPVVRSLAWLAAMLASLPGARGVAWHPARCWSAPGQFRDTVLRWIEGGVFPVFGLAALAPAPDGGMVSEGLALFTGQELRLEPALVEDRAAAARIAVRLLNWLVEHGRLADQEALSGPDGERLKLAPSTNGRFVRVWKD